jgi:hypothetical protein
MKIAFYLYCRAPLGRVLDQILKTVEGYPALLPFQVALTSRHHRRDLPIAETLRSARESASDICRITTPKGELGMTWLYGFRHNVPRMWGDLTIPRTDLAAVRRLLGELRVATDLTYAVCDKEAMRRTVSGNSEPHNYEAEGVVNAVHDLYWWNYFGPEYREHLPLTDAVRAAATEVEQFEDGGLVVVTRRSPKDPIDPERIAALAREWPVFRKYDKKAGFEPPVRIDYSAVWSLPAPTNIEPQPIGTTVGPADEFIASVATHAARFEEWARERRLAVPRTEEDFARLFQEHEAIIRDELLVPTIAAYGEAVRKKMGGVWSKAVLFNRGEPVVVKPGRPWSARRVILEVLEGLEPIEP